MGGITKPLHISGDPAKLGSFKVLNTSNKKRNTQYILLVSM
jgi:hypothetical protein